MLPVHILALQRRRLPRSEPTVRKRRGSRFDKRRKILGSVSAELHEMRRIAETRSEEDIEQLRCLIT